MKTIPSPVSSLSHQRFASSVLRLRHWLRVPLIFLMCLQIPHALTHATPSYPPKEQTGYTFGVFPFLAQNRLEKIFAPIAREISQSLGKPVFYRSSKDFETFMALLKNQRWDVAFVQPFDYVRIAAPLDYVPIVSRGEPLSAFIMVNPDSHLHTLEDLRGQTIALPPPVAAVSYLTILTLEDHGLLPQRDYTLRHVRSHDACLQLLLIGTVQACGSAQVPVHLFEETMGVTFRLLGASPPIMPSLFVVHQRISEDDRLRIQRALLSMNVSSRGAALFLKGAAAPLRPVTQADYEGVQHSWERILNRTDGTHAMHAPFHLP